MYVINALKNFLLEFLHGMFSLNAFIINNKTIGNCKWILIIAFLQDLFHFLGLNRKLFANGFKGFMVKNSYVNISVRKEIASQVLKKPFVLKQEKYGILMLLNKYLGN